MPRGIKEGSKRDRQYEHIKGSYEDRGISEKESEERGAHRQQRTKRGWRDERESGR